MGVIWEPKSLLIMQKINYGFLFLKLEMQTDETNDDLFKRKLSVQKFYNKIKKEKHILGVNRITWGMGNTCNLYSKGKRYNDYKFLINISKTSIEGHVAQLNTVRDIA